jgi:hypothetical protein
MKQPGLDGRHRDANDEEKNKRSDTLTLGLGAFKKISAVEGIRISGRMVKELKSMDTKQLDGTERSRFISNKYGKRSD